MVEETICLQCGNKGCENAFVYCIRCLSFAVHRYCLDEIPETFDEIVDWLCDDCIAKVQKQSAVFEDDAISSQTRKKNNGVVLVVANEHVYKVASERARAACAKFDSVECGESVSQHIPVVLAGKNDENAILLPVDASEISQQSSSLHQLKEEKVEGNLMGSIELSTSCLKRKKKKITSKKKRKRNVRESTTEEDQHRLATPYDEHVKVDINEGTRLASDSTLPSKVKENGCSEQIDDEKKMINKKKKRERNTMVPTTEKDQQRLATASYNEHVKVDIDECTRSTSDSTLPSKVTENCCSEQKDQEEKKIKKTKKTERNIMESSTDKDQHKLATTSNGECVKVDVNECTRLASDSILPSKVKENGFSEQKDEEKKNFKNKKKTENNILESITENGQNRLATASCNERVKVHINECTRSTSVSRSPSKVTEICISEQKDEEKKKIKKKKKKRERYIMEIITEKDQHRLPTASYIEHLKVDINDCTRSVSDSTLPSKVTENCCSEQKDQEKRKIKKRRERNIMEPTTEKDQCRLATATHNECVEVDINNCTRSPSYSDTSLPSKEKENECSIQKGQKKKEIKKKKKRKKNTVESTTKKSQHRLYTASDDEHVKVDVDECTKPASDSTLPSKVKENECSEQKDQACTDVGFAGVHVDHPVISSYGPSKSLKKKETITSSETILQKQVHRTGVAQPLHTDKYLHLENELADLGSSHDPNESRGPEDKEEQTFTSCQIRNTCKYYPNDLGFSVAEPIAMPIWRGSFNIWNEKYDSVGELIAHISSKACYKVYEVASQLEQVLRLEMLPKSNVWPNSFQRAEPSGDNIALYFFPSKISKQFFEQLVEEMMNKELAFKALVQNAELLIFTSTELPLRYWRFRNKYYLWGVFRGKHSAPSNHLSTVGDAAETPSIRKRFDDMSLISPLNNSVH